MAILWLGDPACHDRALVGGKAAYLSRLAADFPVPPGFCFPADGPGAPRRELPGLPDAYRALADRAGLATPAVAVRSSAVDEDSAEASFAGQHETYLNVVGEGEVADAVHRCRDSARAPRALAYRRAQGLADDDLRVAVLVQQLVVADVSAVAFSTDPVAGDERRIVVTASWGLGESIVGGTVTPDTFWLDKGDLGVADRRIGAKERMTIAQPGGTREVGVPRLLREVPALTDDQLRAIGALARRLEGTCGWPVDIECAFARGRLYLLQCRPITALARAA